MNNTFNIKRFSIAFKELWISNRLLLCSFPLVILTCFAIYYLWPGSIFYNKLFHPEEYRNNGAWEALLSSSYSFYNRTIILLLVPIYVVLCTKPTLDKLNTSARFTLVPINRLERTLALTLFAISVVLIGFTSFGLYDQLITAYTKHLYMGDVYQYLEEQGNLFHSIRKNTALFPISLRELTILFTTVILLLPLYFLSLVFFRKYSFISFLGLFTLIMTIIIFMLRWLLPTYDASVVSVVIHKPLPEVFDSVCVIFTWCLAMASFLHKLKEKEI